MKKNIFTSINDLMIKRNKDIFFKMISFNRKYYNSNMEYSKKKKIKIFIFTFFVFVIST